MLATRLTTKQIAADLSQEHTSRPQGGKENIIIMTAGLRSSLLRSGLTTSEILCPVSTSTAVAIAEQPELR